MSKFKKKTDGGIPAISTASLPDIVFMLLFFFMVATVMRENSLKIKNALPVANQVEKLDKKNPVSYIYMGKPSSGYEKFGTESRIQLNDQFAELSEVGAFISAERAALREELIPCQFGIPIIIFTKNLRPFWSVIQKSTKPCLRLMFLEKKL